MIRQPVLSCSDTEYVLKIRRELHAHPELSGNERETRDRLIREMQQTGASITTYDNCFGICAELKNGSGKCIAVRADMDALPIQEPERLPFRSQNPGVMHACGHDVHMALACASARYLSRNKDKWQGKVRFLFEPMEETEGGARLMAEKGCMDGVDAVIGQHVNPNYPAGTYFCKPGYVSGASDEIHIEVHGRSCHGAYPERGVDAVVTGAQIVTALQALVSRTISPFDPVALTFGMISGGKAKNIICDYLELNGTLRTLRPQVREHMHREIRQLVSGIAQAYGAQGETVIRPGYGAVLNDDAVYAVVEKCAERVYGKEHMVLREAPSLGVESICYFFEKSRGAYYDIGSGVGTGLHTPDFLVDEACLASGLDMQLSCIMSLLEESV